VVKARPEWEELFCGEKERINDEGNQIYADLLAAIPRAYPVRAVLQQSWNGGGGTMKAF